MYCKHLKDEIHNLRYYFPWAPKQGFQRIPRRVLGCLSVRLAHNRLMINQGVIFYRKRGTKPSGDKHVAHPTAIDRYGLKTLQTCTEYGSGLNKADLAVAFNKSVSEAIPASSDLRAMEP